jgi:hypothetical protein
MFKHAGKRDTSIGVDNDDDDNNDDQHKNDHDNNINLDQLLMNPLFSLMPLLNI